MHGNQNGNINDKDAPHRESQQSSTRKANDKTHITNNVDIREQQRYFTKNGNYRNVTKIEKHTNNQGTHRHRRFRKDGLQAVHHLIEINMVGHMVLMNIQDMEEYVKHDQK